MKKCQREEGAAYGRCGTVAFSIRAREGILVLVAFGREQKEEHERKSQESRDRGTSCAKIL